MKRKKIILIYSQLEITSSLLRVVMETRGYIVRIVASKEEMDTLAAAAHVCLLVGMAEEERMDCEDALYVRHRGCIPVSVAALDSRHRALWIAELLEKIKIATLRRRGPKPRAGMPLLPVLEAEIQHSVAPL